MRLVLLNLALVCTAYATSDLHLVGVMADEKRTTFALRSDEGIATRWLLVGDKIEGYSVVSYDSEQEALTLQRGGEILILKIPDSHVQAAEKKFVLAPERLREPAKAVFDVLKAENENPLDFHSTVDERDDSTIVFHLWQKDTGEKGRDIVYDVKTRSASSSRFWQPQQPNQPPEPTR